MRKTLPFLFGAALAMATVGAMPVQSAPVRVAPAVVTGEQAPTIQQVDNDNYGWRHGRHHNRWSRNHHGPWHGYRHHGYPSYSYYDRPRYRHRDRHHYRPYSYHRRPGITFEFSF
jgi:hypothetical protein